MALHRAFVVFLSVVCSSEAFLSSSLLTLDSETALKTRDHGIISTTGLLQCMVEFLKDNPQYVEEESVASVENFSEFSISADNPERVEYFFSLIKSRVRLKNVIAEIQSSNAEVNSAPLKNVAAAHFTGEQFKEGSKRLQELKSEVVATLLKGVKFEHARQLAGQYLHTVQDFYSHSNWVELGNIVSRDNDVSPEPTAKVNEATCIPCSVTVESKDDCGEILITEKLTSGYQQGQDVLKPANASKCDHGGFLDRRTATKGGINKDTASKQWSPHYKHHAVAAELAIEATKQFFEDVRSAVGDDIFARFLGLQAIRTLSLVIDDTGSMGEEIKSVRKLSIDFVRSSNNSAINDDFVYILVPFNEPDVGPVTVTSVPDEVIKAVNSLKTNKGGDCPELGMMGLYKALVQSVQDSILYYFSDADAKDVNLAPVVLILAKQKRVKLNFILSGQCSFKRRRRSSDDSSQLGSQALYKSLAAATGGQVLKIQKSKVKVFVDIIGSKIADRGSNDLIEVVLLHASSESKDKVRDVSYFIKVDETLTDILIVLSAEGDPSLILINPSDNQPIRVKVSPFERVHVSEVGSFEGGPLEVLIRCTGPYSLQVTGRSFLDFSYQLSTVHNTKTAETKRLLGSPVKGQTLLINMAFTHPESVNKVDSLSLVDLNGTVMESFTVERGQGMYTGSFYALFTPTSERFRLQLTGSTRHGNLLKRVKPTEIKIETVELGFDHQMVNNFSRIYPGVMSKIPLKIRNIGPAQNFTLKALDDLGFVKSLEPVYCVVAENKTVKFFLVIQAPSNATKGETSTVAIYATPTTSNLPSNYMMFHLSVTVQENDSYPPRCEVVNEEKSCDAIYSSSDCSSVAWNSSIKVSDEGQGILKVIAKNSKIGQLNVAPFTKGTPNSSAVTAAVYKSTCCHPTANIIAVDMVGNTGYCELSAVKRVIKIEADTKYTELNLELGETAKLEFNIRNLGSKGTFIIHTSDSKYFTGYATPFNIKLDHKQKARGEVVVTGLKGTGSEKESLVVKAVPRTKVMNVTRVRLFEILVTVNATEKGTLQPSVVRKTSIKSLLYTSKVQIKAGTEVTVNFSVINVGAGGHLFFKVSSPVFLNCSVTPQSAFLQQNKTMLGRLTVKVPRSAEPQRNLRVTVSAVSSKDKRETLIFTLQVTIPEHTIVEDEIKEAKKEMRFIYIIAIVLGVIILLALVLFLVCLRNKRKRGSWNVWKSKPKQSKERVKVEISKPQKGVEKPEMV